MKKIYFWTATIHNWNTLLEKNEQKEMIIYILDMLSHKNLITVYGFVIMPNHIHVIWKQNTFNGNETPLATFMKYSSRFLLQKIKEDNISNEFIVNYANKIHEIWKRDSARKDFINLRYASNI